MIGYWLVQELHNAGVTRPVVAVVTQTVVDAGDPAFSSPSKFIGPVRTRADAERLAARHGWQVRADGPVTDVSAVMRDFGTPDARPVSHLGVDEISDLRLPAGSMGPKVEACADFTSTTGRPSAIGALTDAAAVLRGDAGTTVTPAPDLDRTARRHAAGTDLAHSS